MLWTFRGRRNEGQINFALGRTRQLNFRLLSSFGQTLQSLLVLT